MLYITTTESKSLTVTLYESCVNVYNPNFTWKLTNQDTNEVLYMCQRDNSKAPWNYNSFTVSVLPEGTPGINGMDGRIAAKPGQYTYEIYEMTEYDNSLFWVMYKDGKPNMVENGILNIIDPTIPNITTYSGNNNYVPTYQNI